MPESDARSVCQPKDTTACSVVSLVSPTLGASLSGAFLQRKEGCRKPVLGVCVSPSPRRNTSVKSGAMEANGSLRHRARLTASSDHPAVLSGFPAVLSGLPAVLSGLPAVLSGLAVSPDLAVSSDHLSVSFDLAVSSDHLAISSELAVLYDHLVVSSDLTVSSDHLVVSYNLAVSSDHLAVSADLVVSCNHLAVLSNPLQFHLTTCSFI